jgi:hypothetical protein
VTFTSNALTIAQTARMVGVTHKAVRKRIAAGGLTVDAGHGKALVSRASAKAWIREREAAARAILANGSKEALDRNGTSP